MDYKSTAKAIKALKIQGASKIALSAVASLNNCKTDKERKVAIKLLSEARPTEPCLRNSLKFFSLKDSSLKDIQNYFKDSKQKIAKYGSRRINVGSTIFSHCHSSTVMDIIKTAKNKKIKVHNTETRPFFQGRITAKELAKAGIKVTHYVDSAARLAIKGADIMLIGCDAITSDGFIVNKIGSEMFAEIANSYEIPVYVCTLSWKFDGRTRFGFDESLESRFTREVWARPPKNVKVSNVVFEKIRPQLITGIISEFGITTVEGFLDLVKDTNPWIF